MAQDKRRHRSYEYDFCISFAGNDRDAAESVANELIKFGRRIFYDRFETANLWGKDLYSHLDHVYRQSARFCILFVSNSYRNRAWTTHERRSAQARAFKQSREYILPVKLDRTVIPGIPPTVGYVDYKTMGAKAIAALAIQKLQSQTVGQALTSRKPSWAFARWEVTIQILNGHGLASYQTDVVLRNISNSPQSTGPLHTAWSGHGSSVSLRNLHCYDSGGRLSLDPDRSEPTPSFLAFRVQARMPVGPGERWHYWWQVNWPRAYRHILTEEHWFTYKGENDVDELVLKMILPPGYVGSSAAKVDRYLGGRGRVPLVAIHGRPGYLLSARDVPSGEQIKLSFRLRR